MPLYGGFHWGIRSFEISNLRIEDNTEDIKTLEQDYNFKLHKISFVVSSANLDFIFHDLEIEEID